MTVLTVDFESVEMAFWSARSGIKNKQYYIAVFFFFIQLCDSRKIHYLTREFHVKLHLKTNIGIPSSGNEFSYRILLDVLFVFRFSKASFYALASSFRLPFIHDILKLRRHLETETYGRLPWQFCNFTCEITNYR